jgi:hypothetical protein
MSKQLPDGGGINKALNAVRGLRNPPALTGRAATIRYPKRYSDPALQEAFLRGLLGIPDSVAVIIVDSASLDMVETEVPPPPPPPVDPNHAIRLANLEKAREAKRAKEEKKQAQNEERLKNLKKARRKLKRMRGG